MPVPRVQDISIDGRTPESLYENKRTKRLLDMLCGEGKPENELTLQNRQWREILKSETKSIKVGPKTDKNGNPVERKGYRFTYYPNFAAISGIISAHM